MFKITLLRFSLTIFTYHFHQLTTKHKHNSGVVVCLTGFLPLLRKVCSVLNIYWEFSGGQNCVVFDFPHKHWTDLPPEPCRREGHRCPLFHCLQKSPWQFIIADLKLGPLLGVIVSACSIQSKQCNSWSCATKIRLYLQQRTHSATTNSKIEQTFHSIRNVEKWTSIIILTKEAYEHSHEYFSLSVPWDWGVWC